MFSPIDKKEKRKKGDRPLFLRDWSQALSKGSTKSKEIKVAFLANNVWPHMDSP